MNVWFRVVYLVVRVAWNQEWPPKRFWNWAIRRLDRKVKGGG